MIPFLTFLLPVTLCIIIHEAGHYFAARHYNVGVNRASLFFNFIYTFIKYDPLSGRLSIISRKVPVKHNGYEAQGEWAAISIPLTKAICADLQQDEATGALMDTKGLLINKTVLKQVCHLPVKDWRRTQYCLGWIPCGGYVSLNTEPNKYTSIISRPPRTQLIINAAGVACNFVTMLLCLVAASILLNLFHIHAYITELAVLLAYYSFALLWLNILPLPGLDGGNMARNICAIYWPNSESAVLKGIYNIFGCIVFVVIVSSWFRPASGIEMAIVGFFDRIFDLLLSLFCVA